MKIKGLGIRGAAGNSVDKLVLRTAALPYCVKELTCEHAGLTYYDKIGHCVTVKNGLFYFEANISAKQFKRLTGMREKGMNDAVFKVLKEISRTYTEFN